MCLVPPKVPFIWQLRNEQEFMGHETLFHSLKDFSKEYDCRLVSVLIRQLMHGRFCLDYAKKEILIFLCWLSDGDT